MKNDSFLIPLFGGAIVALMLLLFLFYMDYRKNLEAMPRFGSVNMALAVELREKSLLSQKLSASEISVAAESFAGQLRSALSEVQKQCHCTLLVKSAVVSPSEIPDYTDALLAKLKLQAPLGSFTPIRENFL